MIVERRKIIKQKKKAHKAKFTSTCMWTWLCAAWPGILCLTYSSFELLKIVEKGQFGLEEAANGRVSGLVTNSHPNEK